MRDTVTITRIAHVNCVCAHYVAVVRYSTVLGMVTSEVPMVVPGALLAVVPWVPMDVSGVVPAVVPAEVPVEVLAEVPAEVRRQWCWWLWYRKWCQVG